MKHLLCCALLLLSAHQARADFIYNVENGHNYELVIETAAMSWDQANATATAMGGHLATITSAQEQAFIASSFDFVNIPGNGVFIVWRPSTPFPSPRRSCRP